MHHHARAVKAGVLAAITTGRLFDAHPLDRENMPRRHFRRGQRAVDSFSGQRLENMRDVYKRQVLAMIVAVGVGLHFGMALLLKQVLYTNPHYTLNEIDIEPRGHFTEYLIEQQAGLKIGQNLWTLNLPQIASDLEKLPYVSNAKVERHFPDRLSILIHERVPVVKIAGINSDLGTKEMFYLCLLYTSRCV